MPIILSADADLDQPLTDDDLGLLQLSTLLYYLRETNPDNGLVRDKTDEWDAVERAFARHAPETTKEPIAR